MQIIRDVREPPTHPNRIAAMQGGDTHKTPQPLSDTHRDATGHCKGLGYG